MPQQCLARRLIEPFRTAAWLTRERVVAWSLVLLLEEILLLGFLALWQHGVFTTIDKPTSSDFVSFYAAGKLALAGTPELAYNQAAHYLAQQQATVVGAPYQYFFYPPVFLFICAPLAMLPYFVAFAVFQAVTMTPFILLMRSILRESGWRWMPPLLAFPAVFWTVGLGQNAFLTAALFGGFTLLVDRRPATAGMLLGAMCYKPHFGLLAPVALLAGRRWRAFFAALAMVAGLASVSILLFGWNTWQAYWLAFSDSHSVYGTGTIDYAGFVTPFGGARLLGFGPWPAYVTQAGVAVLMAGLVALIWRRDMDLPLRGAALLSATLLAVPLALLYDKMLLLVAIGWLLREARDRGFLPWEKLGLASTYPLSLISWGIGSTYHVPVDPLVTAAVVCMCLRRVWRALAARDLPAPPPQMTPSAIPPMAHAFAAPPQVQPLGATP
jgi:hypothetical protein